LKNGKESYYGALSPNKILNDIDKRALNISPKYSTHKVTIKN